MFRMRADKAIADMLIHVRNADPGLEEGAPLPEYSEEGVDLTLIRWMLSLTPAERLEFLSQRITDVLTLRALNARE